jgi:hypothetical protein
MKSAKYTPSLVQALQRFAICANWTSLHIQDERRFWAFVIVARKLGYRLDRQIIINLAKGFLPEKVAWWTKDQILLSRALAALCERIEVADVLLDVLKGERRCLRG